MNPRFDSLDPRRGARSFIFGNRQDEVVAWTLDEVVPALREVERAVSSGAHAAGFVAYEAAPAFDAALAAGEAATDLPLLQFGIFATRTTTEALAGLPPVSETRSYELGPLTASIDRADYAEVVQRVIDLIAAGDTYQVNYTFRLIGQFKGDPLALYRDLCLAQRSAYCAMIETGERVVISSSPELFFRTAGQRVEMRPMKGTRPRGRWLAEDDALAAELAASAKERAENLMIVDLLRNDLGRVADFGTVHVPALFEVERYPTVHQLTSTVMADLRPGVGLVDLFAATFPSGSVTGAPKIHTSRIIHGLEDSPRGVYTGAIGFVSPDESVFSVAIRTLALDPSTGSVEVGVGSGVTADSTADAEYQECLGKGAFLRRHQPEFEILESLRLDDSGEYPLLEDHLTRMAGSARYFEFEFPEPVIRGALASLAAAAGAGIWKVRLRLDRSGRVSVQSESIPESLPPARLAISKVPVDDSNPFLYHKTTNRSIYDLALRAQPGFDDLIFVNSRGELTETSRANLVLEIDGDLLTPPIESGLLSGVVRGRMLAEGRVVCRGLTVGDLHRAERIYLINAVRGWREGILDETFSSQSHAGDAGTS